MKKFLLGCVLVVLISSQGFSQTVDLTPYGGYLLGGKVNYYEGELKYQGAGSYGIMLDVGMNWNNIEFYYSQTPTTAQWRPYLGFENRFPATDYDVTIHYFQLGGLAISDIGGTVEPFGAFTLGATWFQPQDTRIEDQWNFSVTLGGGLKIWMSEKVGIRLQGRLLLPMYFGGISFGCGIGTGGGGCGSGVSATTNHVQGDFLGGIIIRVKGDE